MDPVTKRPALPSLTLDFLAQADIKIDNVFNKAWQQLGFKSLLERCGFKKRSNIHEVFHNTHTLLQKTFEILAVGSLIVIPQTEKQILEDIGLIHNQNCYLIDKENVLLSIEDIFNNVEKYNKVRKAGQEFAKLNFREDRTIQEIRNLIE